jgi:hypothetical protein
MHFRQIQIQAEPSFGLGRGIWSKNSLKVLALRKPDLDRTGANDQRFNTTTP